MNTYELEKKAIQIRKDSLRVISHGRGGHIGGSMSSVDYLVALYYARMHISPANPEDPNRDRFILSKGHCIEGYLSILADLGFLDAAELDTFCQFGSRLIGHPEIEIPGIEMNTGSLGHGLGGACGMALGGKLDEAPYKVYVLVGDGELAEGSNWEALLFANHYHLDNLYVALDRNHLQISGPTENVLGLEPLRQKFEAFGFAVETIDGNDMQQILDALDRLDKITGKPKMIILDTLKGKGVSFMEGKANWHFGKLDEAQYAQGIQDLEKARQELDARWGKEADK